jgi:hypothetical protein
MIAFSRATLQPFFLTYFSTSLFTVYLVFYIVSEHFKRYAVLLLLLLPLSVSPDVD